MKYAALLMVIVVAGCHSEPYGSNFYGASTALQPGPEERLTFSAGDRYGDPFHADAVSWAEDGSGIVLTYGPRSYQVGETTVLRCRGRACPPGPRDLLDSCAGMLPPAGGSAYWEFCETGNSHTDSTDLIGGPAVNSHGQLLYAELTGSWELTPPIDYHGALWVADPMNPRGHRKVLDLYPTGAAFGNMLSAIQWSGDNAFFARGETLSNDSPVADLGPVVHGTLGDNGASVVAIPGTGGTSSYAVIESGRAILVTDSGAVVRRVSVPDGATSTAGTIPLTATAATLGVSCGATICAVLTNDNGSSTIWRLDPATGAVSVLRTFSHSIGAIAVSPSSGRIVVIEGVNLFLLDLVVQ